MPEDNRMNKKKKNSPVGTIIFCVLLAAVIIGLYFMLTRKKEDTKNEIPVETSEADNLIKKDIDYDYPATPREVLRLYARITKCIYSDDITDEQIEKLVKQVRKLYANALLENNAEEEQIAFLKGDISEYRKENKIIYSYAIDSASNINVIKTKAGNTALIKMYFTLRAGASMDRAFEEFSMLEEDGGKWKIAGWRPAEEKSLN